MTGNTYLEIKLLKNLMSKLFCYNNLGIRKIKDFLKISNEKIFFTLESNNTKYIIPFKFISWSNFVERYHNFHSDI